MITTTTVPNINHLSIFRGGYRKKIREASLNGKSPHHLSFQNFTLFPEPTMKQVLTSKSSQPFLFAFQTPTLYFSLTPFMHQTPSSCPYLPTITHFQIGFFSITNLQNHLPKRALLKVPRVLNLNPLFTFFQANNQPAQQMGFFNQSSPTPKEIPLNLFSNLATTLSRMTKRYIVNR